MQNDFGRTPTPRSVSVRRDLGPRAGVRLRFVVAVVSTRVGVEGGVTLDAEQHDGDPDVQAGEHAADDQQSQDEGDVVPQVERRVYPEEGDQQRERDDAGGGGRAVPSVSRLPESSLAGDGFPASGDTDGDGVDGPGCDRDRHVTGDPDSPGPDDDTDDQSKRRSGAGVHRRLRRTAGGRRGREPRSRRRRRRREAAAPRR